MLAAEAVRLAAIEVLCPTQAIIDQSGFPTLAGERVYDSRAVPLQDLDAGQPYTPVLALYTAESGSRLRSAISDASDRDADAVIDIVAELAVGMQDEGGQFADAMAEEDPDARLVLAALTAQVRYLLEHAPSGSLFRRVVHSVSAIEIKTFSAPELGMRWQRQTIRLHCDIRDDDFDVPDGELPEPCRTLLSGLPAQSYARAKLAALAAHFAQQAVPALKSTKLTTAPGVTGEALPQP
ncbi:hypothetical protein [Sinorhizobium sp. BG8]|uniref:hypothetical protein n=1 Tax=Sinorhizobium sp. BG8 TaxID=2613773 RepID=UPI00193D1F26|nr:hypothetical protein [Sinorhizobium sp. BG8]QRM55144.1 hypothetical protein F3Y30_11820 [Sinorhizobium sp. BG8]